MLRAPGKPLHPPLTDASIGAYTAGVAMLVLGALGVEEEQMAHGALLAISFGLIVAAPTALTGLLDWLDIPKGTPARNVATLHLWTMVTATVLFALTWLAQLDGYKDDDVRGLAVALGVVAFVLLARRRGWFAAARRHPYRSGILAVLLVAVAGPALKAARIAPIEALRGE